MAGAVSATNPTGACCRISSVGIFTQQITLLLTIKVFALELEILVFRIAVRRPFPDKIGQPCSGIAGILAQRFHARGVLKMRLPLLGLGRQIRHAGTPAVGNTDITAEMREHGRSTAAVLVEVSAREGVTATGFGTEFEEERGRRDPLQLHAILNEAGVIAEHGAIHQRRIGEVPHVRVLLVQITDAGAETTAAQANAGADTERLEPGLFDFDLTVEHGENRLASPVGVDVGRQHQLGMIDREAAFRDAFDPVAMIVAARRHKAGDAALGDVLHVLVLALQDQRDLGVETAGTGGAGDARRRGGHRRSGLGSDRCRSGGCCPRGGLALRFGFCEFLFERGDTLLVGFLHVVDLGADGGEIGVGCGLRAARGGQQRGHGKWLVHGILLKIVVGDRQPARLRSTRKNGKNQERGGARCEAGGAGKAPRSLQSANSGTRYGTLTAGGVSSEVRAAPRFCALRHNSQACLGKLPSSCTRCSTACADAASWAKTRTAARSRWRKKFTATV